MQDIAQSLHGYWAQQSCTPGLRIVFRIGDDFPNFPSGEASAGPELRKRRP